QRGFNGDNQPATTAQLNYPRGLTVDAHGNLYTTDTDNERIRKVDTHGTITTVAGTGQRGFNGDNQPATTAQLASPWDVAVDAHGNLYTTDTYNHRIRKVDLQGTISTVAGTGQRGFNGDNQPATTAQLNYPRGLTVDAHGNLYITDTDNERIRKVDTHGTIATVAGTGQRGFNGDNQPATTAQLASPWDVAVDAHGTLYIADTYNERVRRVDAWGTITTVAGSGEEAGQLAGDGEPLSMAFLKRPCSLAFDSPGNLYIADTHRIRRILPPQ
ncbi:NHL repeat-containing protein, partial [Streptomyces sp. NPDC005529]